MQKTIMLITLIILTISPVFGLTLEGGVTYTVESARKEAFSGVKYKIPVSSFKKYMQDPNFEENKAAIAAGNFWAKDRHITVFSDGEYSIIYYKDRYKVYTYNKNGKLVGLSIRSSLTIPMKAYQYTTKGELEGVELYVSLEECYIFDEKGEFGYHWIGNDCYDKNGKWVVKEIR